MLSTGKRAEYLKFSLLVEDYISSYLSSLIGVKEAKESISFGNKSSSLSFQAKVNLLLDMEVLDKKNDKWKLQKFMEIRNQFMHNIDADNCETCISFINGAKDKLLKEYPQDENLAIEDQLRQASLALANEALLMTKKVFIKLLSKVGNEGHKAGLKIVAKASSDTIKYLQEKASKEKDPDKISLSEYWEVLEKRISELNHDESFTTDLTFELIEK